MKKAVSLVLLISMLLTMVSAEAAPSGWASLGDGMLTVKEAGAVCAFSGKTASYAVHQTPVVPNGLRFALTFDQIPAYSDGAFDGKIQNAGMFISATLSNQADIAEYSTRDKWEGITALMYLKNQTTLSVEVFSNTASQPWVSVVRQDVTANVVDGGTIEWQLTDAGLMIDHQLIPISDHALPRALEDGAYLQMGSNATAYRADIAFSLSNLQYETPKHFQAESPVYKSGEQTDTAVNLLYRLGVLELYEDMSFRPENTVTRAEFVDMLLRVLRIEPIEGESLRFVDVPSDHPYYKSVQTGYQLGLFIGTADRMFDPNRVVSYGEAVKMLVHALGCEQLAESKGGYPFGYAIVAQERGIGLSGSVPFATLLSRGLTAELMYRAMQAPYLKLVGISGEGTIYNDDEEHTILSDVHDVYRVKGMMEANSDVALGSSLAPRDAVIVDGVVYEVNDREFSEPVGFEVELYYRRESGEVVYLETTPRNEVITVRAEDIIDVRVQNSIRFEYIDNDKNQTIELPLDTDVIKNRVRLSTNDMEAALDAENGTVTFVDYNSDSDYDVVYVQAFDTVVVDQVGYQSLKVTDLLTQREITLEDAVCEVQRNGKSAGLNSLQSGDVADVYEGQYNGKPHYVFQICDSFEGVITSVSSESVTVGDKEYRISDTFRRFSMNKLEFQQNMVFYVNGDGELAYADPRDSEKPMYAYLCAVDYERSIDQGVKLKLYSQLGEMLTVNLAECVVVDGSKLTRAEIYEKKTLDHFTLGLISFSQNAAGAVNRIDPPQSMAEANEFGLSYSNDNAYYRRNASFESEIYVDQNTQFIVVPKDKNEEAYYGAFRGWGSLAVDHPYNVKCYLKDEYNVAKLVLIEQPNNVTLNLLHDNVFVLDRRTNAMVNGEEVIKIYGTIAGTYEEYIVRDPSLLEGLTQGDVFNVKVSLDKEVQETIGMFASSNYETREKSNIDYVHSVWTRVYGDVVKVNEQSKKLVVDDGTERTYDLTPGYLPITVVNTEKDTVRTGSIRDIEAGQYIFMIIKESVIYNLVVYQ